MGMITRVEVDKKYQDVEKPDLGYIWAKSNFVLKYMKGPNVIVEPTEKKIRSYQAAFYILVNIDEKINQYLWYYKPEVTFSMPSEADKIRKVPAVPHLISKYVKVADRNDDNFDYGENRRHSPSWRSKLVSMNKIGSYRRRPDLIIVKDPQRRWPGGDIDTEDSIYQHEYDDNIKRLVEMKFPKDAFHRGQEDDYQYISGINRFSTVWITEDNDQTNHEHTFEFSPDLVPIFANKHLPDAYKLETWVHNSYRPINLLREEQIKVNLSDYFRPETLRQLEVDAPWLFKTGDFAVTSNGEYSFVPEDGSERLTYSTSELQQAWQDIRQEVDIDDEQLNETTTPLTYSNSSEVIELPTIVIEANATTSMTTGDKIILGLEIAATIALFIPGVNIAAGALRAGLFLFRLAKTARHSSRVARGLQSIFNSGRQVAPAF
ncbi:MAG: VRR-NUC domain-containing protein [Acinetobacter venetianus]|uniref:VRR-NUC domain-containing protein n=1 Tax=Acinetobacter venetianus TaxID=52133 RepID=UPI0035BE7232